MEELKLVRETTTVKATLSLLQDAETAGLIVEVNNIVGIRLRKRGYASTDNPIADFETLAEARAFVHGYLAAKSCT